MNPVPDCFPMRPVNQELENKTNPNCMKMLLSILTYIKRKKYI